MITILICKPDFIPENETQRNMLIAGAEFFMSAKRAIIKDYLVKNNNGFMQLTIPNEVFHNAF